MGNRSDHSAARRRAVARLVPALALLVGSVVVASSTNVGAETSGALPGTQRGAAISAGGAHSCAIVGSGDVVCWGAGGAGRLGQDDNEDYGSGGAGEMMADLDPIGLDGPAISVAAGGQHTCALLDGGDVVCWGQNTSGKLGQDSGASAIGDSAGDMASLDPIELDGPATAVAVGGDHSCALLDGGDVTCWGANDDGQLGLGDDENRGDDGISMSTLSPIDLGAGRTATAIAAGDAHTCALLEEGSVKCWGSGGAGRLGQDSSSNVGDAAGQMGDALPPIDLGAGRTLTAVATGGAHTCALLAGGDAACWGNNGAGRLGIGTTDQVGSSSDHMGENLATVPVDGDVRAISAGAQHTCVVSTADDARCWGRNFNGQLGKDDTDNAGEAPGEVAALGPIAVGGDVEPIVTTAAPPTEVEWAPSGGSVDVSWAAPADDGGSPVTGYRVQRSADGGLTWTTVVADTGSTASSATAPGPDGADVRYRVAALNAVGLGAGRSNRRRPAWSRWSRAGSSTRARAVRRSTANRPGSGCARRAACSRTTCSTGRGSPPTPARSC